MGTFWWRVGGGRARRAVGALLLALAVSLSAPGAGAVLADEVAVTIAQPGADPLAWRYDPSSLTVPAGTTVTWSNQGTTPMTVTSPDGLFDAEVPPGGSFSVTFDSPGTYRYFCVPYPHMKGTVVVTRPPGGQGSGVRGQGENVPTSSP